MLILNIAALQMRQDGQDGMRQDGHCKCGQDGITGSDALAERLFMRLHVAPQRQKYGFFPFHFTLWEKNLYICTLKK